MNRGLNVWFHYSPYLQRKNQRLPETIETIGQIAEFCENYKPHYFQNMYNLVILPYVQTYSKETIPQSYLNVGCIDENNLLFDGQVKSNKQKKHLFKTMNMSLLLDFLRVVIKTLDSRLRKQMGDLRIE